MDTTSGPRVARAWTAEAQTPVQPHLLLGLADGEVLGLYRLMLLARRMSERALLLTRQSRVDIAIPSDGHEAAQIGSMHALSPTDFAYLFYRSMPAALARGMRPWEIMCDYMGKARGPSSGGKNIPGHWACRELNLMSISGSVATQVVNAVGTALASRTRGERDVTIVYFGDGGASKADFHEGLSFASIHKLPVVFFCENNRYAISVPFELQSAVPSVADRAPAYAMPGVAIDGMDVLEVFRATRDALERARRGEGPTLIEASVYRFSLHTSHVGVENYRSPEEIEQQRARDPIPRFRRYLDDVGLLDAEQATVIEQSVLREVDQAVERAEQEPYPQPEQAFRHVAA
jgi:2-oxoisovalerate dehydrogenase E1 component alpha subunit